MASPNMKPPGLQECGKDAFPLGLLIVVLPYWIIGLTLVVVILRTLIKSLRANHIYDNCSKHTAIYAYLIEIRTGDTSSMYNRRRTTLIVDMFDDHQAPVSRLSIPGHMIFGKKDTPTHPIEDERYFDLRVTRFWLHRPSRLKKPSIIRLTHTCVEGDARIMVYAMELRGREHNFRIFFPIMSYISVYGSASKPNACFDADPTGDIAHIGGEQPETLTMSNHLTWNDFTIMFYLFSSVLFFLTSQDSFFGRLDDMKASVIKGLIVGALGLSVALLVAIILKYGIKMAYARNLGYGLFALVYYIYLTLLLGAGSGVWAGSAIIGYGFCPDQCRLWLVSLGSAYLTAATLYALMRLSCLMCTAVNNKSGYASVQEEQVAVPRQQFITYHPMIPPSPYNSYKPLGTGLNPLIPPPIGTVAGTIAGNTGSAPKRSGSQESTGSTYYHQVMKTRGGVKSISQYGELLKQKKTTSGNYK